MVASPPIVCCNGCQQSQKQLNRPLLRCGSCRAARYCSIECQRDDWHARHRQLCVGRRQRNTKLGSTFPPKVVTEAWKELSHLLATASPEQLHHDLYVASNKAQEEMAVTTKDSELQARIQRNQAAPQIQRSQSSSSQAFAQQKEKAEFTSWHFYMEDLTQIGCFQILLRPVQAGCVSLSLLRVSTAQHGANPSRTLLTVVYDDPVLPENVPSTILRIELPRQVPPPTDHHQPQIHGVEDNHAILVRLSYQNCDAITGDTSYIDDSEPFVTQAPSLISPIEASQCLACASCRQFLLQSPQRDNGAAKGVPLPGKSDDKTDNSSASVAATDTITRVLPLPTGHWDEMQDYLICFEGQATVDFGSSSTFGQRGTLLEDATTLVAHRLDVGMAACVVALPGYGTADDCQIDVDDRSVSARIDGDGAATIRGSRPWREAVGGATLTCSQCACLVGFAPIELADTCRLLKHRLVTLPLPTLPSSDGMMAPTSNAASLPVRRQTISSFIAHEMVRYAETKAIFNFVVAIEDDTSLGVVSPTTSTRRSDSSRRQRRILRLRIVSWATPSSWHEECACTDARASASLDDVDVASSSLALVPQWRKRCKILYQEEREDVAESASNGATPLQWTWSQNGDWCCPPARTRGIEAATEEEDSKQALASPISSTAPTSSVRIVLPMDEWEQLTVELQQGTAWYSKDLAVATMAAMMGRQSSSSPTATPLAETSGLASIVL